MADLAARALGLPVDDDDLLSPSDRRPANSSSNGWHRRATSESAIPDRPRTATARWLRSARRLRNKGHKLFMALTPLQRAAVVALNAVLLVSLILFAVFNERIFAALTPVAKSWRELPAGWLILWLMVFLVSFPPLIGYSSCVTIAGFVWGMKGWFIIASATIVGSTVSFLVSRTLLKRFVGRLTDKNKRFTALALVLKHDGLKLLVMIRLCPLPYSLSNGAISTIPTVTWYNFMLATAIVSPKLLLHIFVGAEIGKLAKDGSQMSAKTRAVSYLSIALGILVGIGTGYFIYSRTKARAAQLEAEEAAAARERGGRAPDDAPPDYTDDPIEREAVNILRRDDDVSLHTAFADEDAVERGGYRDEFTDDEDAHERDVFEVGDGDLTGDEDEEGWKGQR